MDDLPATVAAALREPSPGREWTVDIDGLPWRTLAWGDPTAPPVLLIHGVTSNAETFWRIGPAVAATGRHVVAVDLPGHGRTGGWRSRHRFLETAADLAAFVRVAGLEPGELAVLGHSWGGMIVASLPAAGLRPAVLILLDPPALPVSAMELMTNDPAERHYPSLAEARAFVREANPGWHDGDVEAKAQGIQDFDEAAVYAVLVENGDWDGGLAALADPAAAGIPTWLIRGEFETGGLIPEAWLPAFQERLGPDRVITIAEGPHSPQRTHPEATTLAILRALGGA